MYNKNEEENIKKLNGFKLNILKEQEQQFLKIGKKLFNNNTIAMIDKSKDLNKTKKHNILNLVIIIMSILVLACIFIKKIINKCRTN